MLVTGLLCLFFFCFSLWFRTINCLAVYNITSSKPLFENETLVSSNQTFELGFFTPGITGHLYVGIWYKNISPTKIVWVANREKPVVSAEEAASLRIGTDGNLQLDDGRQNAVWSTNVTVNYNNSSAELLDNGNLVLKDSNSGNIMWESFDHPCDAFLPGMKLGINFRTGEKNYLVSWKSDNDPAPGDFVIGITPEVPPQAMGWNKSLPYWRGGQWDKAKFIGIEDMDGTYTSMFSLQQDPGEGTYLSFVEDHPMPLVTLFLSSNGTLKIILWDDSMKDWWTNWEAPSNLCQTYGVCGPFGICRASNTPICSCLRGFVPKSYEEWNRGNWTGGCRRQTTLNCQRSTNTSSTKDKFWKMSNVTLPDLTNYLPDIMDNQECLNWCLDNCSCQAYSYVDSIGCLIWTEPLIDMVIFNSSGKDLFIRLAQVDAGGAKPTRKLILSFVAVLIVVIVGVVAYCLCKWRATQKNNMADKKGELQQEKILREQLKFENKSELPLFSLDTILVATENFSVTHKLGQGGFGPVYWGKLEDGRDVAVKRLSSNSVQGMEEFKNEIVLISKFQHRNLIKLVGCCIEGEEKILIYEFLPNKSLDTFLFDSTRKSELNWDKRFNIIQGIAKGLMYLHSDSCLRVIHRDLKASNILLDQKMNPKISDFGLARMFQDTQVLVNTHRVVGTFGYMSPEYAMGGIFSEKSDVYSFGVLVLEIVAGKKNSLFHKREENLNLVFYAWQLWSQDRGLELVDETLVGTSSPLEVMKCIHIGLLCVQDHNTDRPNMATVVLMLSGDSNLPQPKQPTFTSQSWSDKEIQPHEENTWSSNTITNSVIEGR